MEPDFWFSTLFFATRWKHCPMPEKTSQKWAAFAFGIAHIYCHQTFIKCVPDVTASYGTPWFYCVFWAFTYIIIDHSCLNCCIKLLQIVCLINTHILICWHGRYNNKLRKALWFNSVLWKFQCLILYSSSNFHTFYGK